MICLDTNYLIRGVVKGTSESEDLIRWFRSGENLIVPMPAWYEFVCGPITKPQESAMRAFLTEIVPFSEAHAAEGARLFNVANRKRSLRFDAMIAGTAIVAGARLATRNLGDFSSFIPHGLILV